MKSDAQTALEKEEKMTSTEINPMVFVLAVISLFIGAIGLAILGGLVKAFVLFRFAQWFFPHIGIAPLQFSQAVIVTFVAELLLFRVSDAKEEDAKKIFTGFLAYPIWLLMGYIIHLFIR